MNRTDEMLTATMAAYSQAVLRKDAEAFLQLYDPEVRIFDAWDAWSYEGRDAWRECIRAWYAADPDDVHVRFDDVHMCNDNDLATLTAVVTYAAFGPDGTQAREIQNRLTWILRHRCGVWRIVHEHTSAPIHFGHSRPILHRVRTLGQQLRESLAPSASP